MGNQQNSSNTDKKKKKENITETKKINNSNFQNIHSKDSNSSYKGVKTTTGDNSNSDFEKDQKTEETSETITIQEKIDIKDIKIPTLFEWKEGGSIVYITGNFSNWSQRFMMTKSNNKFELILVLKIITFLFYRIYQKEYTNINLL